MPAPGLGEYECNYHAADDACSFLFVCTEMYMQFTVHACTVVVLHCIQCLNTLQ